MASTNRVDSLRSRHAALDRAIREEQARPAPDSVALRRLKAEKLLVKEEIDRTAAPGAARASARAPS